MIGKEMDFSVGNQASMFIDPITIRLQKGIITFRVTGEPKGQPRPRAFARQMGGKFVARVYDAGTAEGWKSCIAEAARPFLPTAPLQGPLKLTIAFYMPRPKGHYRSGNSSRGLKGGAPLWHTSKPDVDNLLKSTLDCLVKIGFLNDDAQICHMTAEKRYAEKGDSGALIQITDLDNATGLHDLWNW